MHKVERTVKTNAMNTQGHKIKVFFKVMASGGLYFYYLQNCKVHKRNNKGKYNVPLFND